MFRRIRAAWAALTAPSTTDEAPTAPTASTANSTRDITDHARLAQARDVQNLHMDTHHHGGTVTNTNNGGTVGLQAGHVNGGVFNVGGHNTISGSAIGQGATVNTVGNVHGGQVIQAGQIHGGVSYTPPTH